MYRKSCHPAQLGATRRRTQDVLVCGPLRRESLPADAGHGPESFRHHFEGLGVVVDENEVAPQYVGRHTGRAAAGEEVEHEIAGVRGGRDDAAEDAERLLGRIARPLGAARGDDRVPPRVRGEFTARGLLGSTSPGAMYGMRSISSALKT